MGLSTEEFITQLKGRLEEAEGVLTRAGFTKAGDSVAWKPPVNLYATAWFQAEKKIETMREAIRSIEWGSYQTMGHCPACGGYVQTGHVAQCPLMEALTDAK